MPLPHKGAKVLQPKASSCQSYQASYSQNALLESSQGQADLLAILGSGRSSYPKSGTGVSIKKQIRQPHVACWCYVEKQRLGCPWHQAWKSVNIASGTVFICESTIWQQSAIQNLHVTKKERILWHHVHLHMYNMVVSPSQPEKKKTL